jgi:hypothetical protein
MGNKREPAKKWGVSLEAVYRRDRDERVKRAYELALPLLASKAKSSIPKKEIEDGQSQTDRNLCSRIERKAG